MTYKRREEIFSKEVLSYTELAELLDICPSMASTKMSEIKMKSDRLKIKGKIHIQDYLDWLGVKEDGMLRYCRQADEEKLAEAMKRTVCV